MRKLVVYERIDSAIGRCKELAEAMVANTSGYGPGYLKSLASEYKWTVKRIISLCEEALEDPDYGSCELQFKTLKLLEMYKSMDDIIES
tara:strand:- start:355 stop:621 length:267 start_codon:yes stop_codon:yes gene_type:complete